MTIALCLRCGETKHGALLPCRVCKAEAVGDPDIDITFCDHVLTVATLKRLGAVIRRLRMAGVEREVALMTFMRYFREQAQPLGFAVRLPDLSAEMAAQVETAYDLIRDRPITIEAVERVDQGPPTPVERVVNWGCLMVVLALPIWFIFREIRRALAGLGP